MGGNQVGGEVAKIRDTSVCGGEGTREPWEFVERGRDVIRWHFGRISLGGRRRGLVRLRGWQWGGEHSWGRRSGEEGGAGDPQGPVWGTDR